ncbi:MAG: TetR/AcrR family transcriptional regulator [Desulfobacterales bacterium]|jgi:AcrR family transcriptional regulator|nr:TetR/AcrR family transcriptional regulator [Desulfobacterales bacterium]
MGIHERKKREKEHRRQQIMVAAKKLFAAKGFSRATIEEIATEAELSPGTLYLYFKNKDELFAALSIKILKYLIARLEKLCSETELSPDLRLIALKDVLYDACAFDSWILINTFRLQASDMLRNLTDELVAEIDAYTCRIVSIMADILAKGIVSGVFIDRPANSVASVLWALFSGAVLFDESQRGDHEQSRALQTLDSAFEIFSRGISRMEPVTSKTIPGL